MKTQNKYYITELKHSLIKIGSFEEPFVFAWTAKIEGKQIGICYPLWLDTLKSRDDAKLKLLRLAKLGKKGWAK